MRRGWIVTCLYTASLCGAITSPVTVAVAVPGSSCERSLALDELQSLALEKSPLLAEIDSEYANQISEAFNTEVMINPELQAEQAYASMGLNGDNDPQANVSLAQRLKLSNFGQRQRVATLLRKVGDTQRGAKLLELTQKINLQFYTLHALQRSEKILIDSEELASKKVVLVHQGVLKGLLSEGDHKLFEAEKFRLQAQRRGLQASIHALQSELSKAVGSACIWSARSEPVFSALPSEEELLAKARASRLSDMTRADLMLGLASEQVRLAELDRYPEIAPRIIYQHTNDGGDFIGAGIAIPLPLFNRNQGDIARAQAVETAARRKKEVLSEGGLEAQIRALRSAVIAASEQVEMYTSKVVPAYEAALRSQERLYAQGKGNVLQVWQTLRLFSEARNEALTLWLNVATLRIQLSLLVGEEI
jgi:cobalt-zinc-cadmium efflux system outer membrane protein